MKVNGNAIRPGNIIEHQGRLWKAVKIQHTQPGKGGAYLQVELKDIQSGTKLNERFRSSETVEKVRIDEKECQYLYPEGASLIFMDNETFEQFIVDESMLGEGLPFLKEGMAVTLETYEDEIVGIRLPKTVVLTVVEAEPVIKGQTATASYKPSVLEKGVRLMVPPYIAPGIKIVVNTEEMIYVERAQNTEQAK